MEAHISKARISKRRANSLNAFVQAAWGSPEAVLKQDHHLGLHYIDTTMFPLAFEVFLGPSAIERKKILIRREYETALNELETNEVYCRGAYVTGQPGIGKSFFLAYILVMRLGKRCLVAWQLTDGKHYLLLKDTSTVHPLDESEPLEENGPTWALSDSDDEVRSPSGIFYRSLDVRTIQATSPKASRWKEWAKQGNAECYVMDIWSKNEIIDLAKLLELDVAHMTALAKSWSGVPRRVLRFLRMETHMIEREYRGVVEHAVRNCRLTIGAIEQKNVVDEIPSRFYFYRPEKTEFGINRMASRVVVPMLTLLEYLGEALQEQDNATKIDFLRVMTQCSETRGATGSLFETWFHCYISGMRSIQCHWVQGSGGVALLTGTSTLIPSTWDALKLAKPPCYWVVPTNTPGIDSALILDKEIYVFQVTISHTHTTPVHGLKVLQDHLPAVLKKLGWRVVFIGYEDKAIEPVARRWVGDTSFPMGRKTVIGWSEVDPMIGGIPYREIRRESDPDDVPMEDVME